MDYRILIHQIIMDIILMSTYYVLLTVQSYWHILALNWSLQQPCEVSLIDISITRWGNGHSEATGLTVGEGSVPIQGACPHSGCLSPELRLTITHTASLEHESISNYFCSTANHSGRQKTQTFPHRDVHALISRAHEYMAEGTSQVWLS